VRKLSASRELLAPLADVWAFVAEPHNFPNWWPRVGGVRPDRRGLAPGARWEVIAESEPTLLRRPASVGELLVLAVEPDRRLAFRLTAERLEVELRLEPAAADRTRATLEVRGSWWAGLSPALPRGALDRLWALCQTGAA
jgi:uncharacterized protein YndB with AHSA1/START domain